MNRVRHFRTLVDINKNEFINIIDRAIEYKKLDKSNLVPKDYNNKVMAMIFKKTQQELEFHLKQPCIR